MATAGFSCIHTESAFTLFRYRAARPSIPADFRILESGTMKKQASDEHSSDSFESETLAVHSVLQNQRINTGEREQVDETRTFGLVKDIQPS